ncbi:GDSL esterase/lipase [Striga hermonthica]|uniref:GDSL esterase/lipase n=1 Tax=Striga hermonthica TaxID=68872 RepID=A0A9N7NCF4_STRHE|nr:GDSL esterase/lipase [Striga hermonthica]
MCTIYSNWHLHMKLALYMAIAVVAVVVPVADRARAFFVFGDSLVNNGNNNYLATTARADSPPYGIDYPTHRPTGRFSNGYNIPDLISQALRAESTLAYLNPELQGEKLLVGANFASAGIGILSDTGIQFRLYELGARQVLVTGTGPLGCVPAELATKSRNGECAEEPQRAAAIFNPLLVQMIAGLNQEIGSNVFVTANTMQMQNDFINNLQAYGRRRRNPSAPTAPTKTHRDHRNLMPPTGPHPDQTRRQQHCDALTNSTHGPERRPDLGNPSWKRGGRQATTISETAKRSQNRGNRQKGGQIGRGRLKAGAPPSPGKANQGEREGAAPTGYKM